MVNIEALPEASLTPAQLKGVRDRLSSDRQKLADSIAALNALIDAKQDCEIRDSGSVVRVFRMSVMRLANKRFATVPDEVRQRACVIAKHHKAMIFEIDQALGRIDERRYAISESSGETFSCAQSLMAPLAQAG